MMAFRLVQLAVNIWTISIMVIALNAFTYWLYRRDKYERAQIFFAIACGGIGAFLGAKNRRKPLVVIGLVIALIPMIHIAHSLTLDRIIRYTEITFSSENWPSELDGYRIAFMADKHTIADEAMRRVIRELNGLDIDLLLLGGDFSMGGGTHFQGTLREIAQTNAPDGIFGVEGNHDRYYQLFAEKMKHGIIPLDNSGEHIHEGFFVAGVHDLWRRKPCIETAVAGSVQGDFVLVISHNPDVAMLQPTAGVDLILSGHTHGGQITFFGFPVYLLRNHITRFGTRFTRGFAESADGVPVFVSTGVGVYYNVPRVFARPEVVIFTMYTVTKTPLTHSIYQQSISSCWR
ncbi:MAG: metallophosphoesterase [Defluviitaleaceae bacterium]|nr:metallophosphoesterase [Defluviitaleaceae bacterium]